MDSAFHKPAEPWEKSKGWLGEEWGVSGEEWQMRGRRVRDEERRVYKSIWDYISEYVSVVYQDLVL